MSIDVTVGGNDQIDVSINGDNVSASVPSSTGVVTFNGLSGAVSMLFVGGTVSYAGNTITVTITGGGAGAVTSVAGRTGDVVIAVADVSGAVATSDSRLSDSREWSASTVTQADAEAGVATVRVAWTVQRVWQAIAAWWAASASKAKLDGIASGATANQTDAYLLARANHTGTQSYTTITGLGTLATQSGTFSGTSSGTNTGDQTITLTGDVTGSGTGSFAATLAASGVTAATYGSASSVPVVVVDAAGRITSASSTAIAISSGSVSGLATVATSGSAADLTGTLAAARLPNTTVTAGSYGSASSVATFTVDAAGRMTAAGSTAIAIASSAVSGLGSLATLSSLGNVTSAGAIGSTSGQIVVTTTSGVLTTATIGSGLTLSGGTLTASGGGGSYTLPAATTTTLGGVIVGSGLAVDGSGNLTVNERLYTTLSSTTTSATTTETTLASASVTGAANDVFRIRWWGTFTNNSGAACTYTFRVKLGSTTIATVTRAPATSTATVQQWGEAIVSVISTTSQTGTLVINQAASNSSGISFGCANGVATETISSALTLSVTCQMSASTGTPSAPQFVTTAAWIERTKG